MNIFEGFTEFDYQNPPEKERQLYVITYDSQIAKAVYTWDEERKCGVFFSDENFIDIDDIKYWRYA